MRVLVISTNRERSPQALVPLGACLVANSARAAGHEAAVLDLAFARDPVAAVAAQVASLSPDVVGLSVRNLDNCDYISPRSYLPGVRQLVEACREVSAAEIVLGGPAVSEAPEQIARYLGCRLAVVGEGEIAFPALLAALATGADAAAIPGVMALQNGAAQQTPVTPSNDLTALPRLPANLEHWRGGGRPWLDWQKYRSYGAAWPVQTKRGCAFQCSYCVYPLLEGPGWRLRDPEAVAEEVELGARSGLRLAEIVDSIFGFPYEHAAQCCEAVARRRRRLPLCSMEFNPTAATPELVAAMNAADFTALAVTAESGSDTMLSAMRKSFSVDDLHHAVDNLRGLRARKLWIFMLGGPGETEATVKETARFLERLPASDLALVTHGIRVLPRTALCQELTAAGEISAEANLEWPTFYYSPHLTPQRAEEILAGSSFPSVNRLQLTDGGHRLLPLVQRVSAAAKLRPPYWRHAKWLNRLRRLTGL